jgi:thioredoxin-related protein
MVTDIGDFPLSVWAGRLGRADVETSALSLQNRRGPNLSVNQLGLHSMTATRARTSALLLVASLLLATGVASAEPRDPGEFFFDSTFGDFREELAKAKDEGKKGVLVMFEMDDCPFCQRMKATVLNQPEVQDFYRANFVVLPLDIEGDLEITDFAGKHTTQKAMALDEYRVRATPVFGFFDLDGKMVVRYTGATKDVAEFMLLGRFVADGAYANTNFPTYKREQQKAAKP